MHDEMTVILKLGEISGKLDALINQVGGQDQKITAIESRVRTLENNKYLMMGIAFASGGGAGIMANLFT